MKLSDSALPALSTRLVALSLLILSFGAAAAGPPVFNPTPPPQTGNPIYSQGTDIRTFTGTVQQYATFIDGIGGFSGQTSLFVPIPGYTPTNAILEAPGYARVVGSPLINPFNNPPLIVQFSQKVSDILVFPSIDHVGFGWDVYQYSIWGGTLDANNVINFDLLFDPITVNGTDVPGIDQNFTLNTWAGMGPIFVNNGLTNNPTNSGPGFGPTRSGYEAYFDFSTVGLGAYEFYGFLPGLVTRTVGADQEAEIDAVAEAVRVVPEPATLALLSVGLAGLGFSRRRQ